ncbi:hypothetical protein LG21E20_15250 [Lactococcus formosensis]|nr:hypothetical protein LG21E20_15250 [Lactococcus formosensis]BDX25452.1 hypothetical protein LFMS200408A_15290 [Lactococcus formosensis]
MDIYNSISLRYGVPCGGEDLDKINGDLHLGLAKGVKIFILSERKRVSQLLRKNLYIMTLTVPSVAL